eukprot:TRINITY_DN16779_c0_g1_i1.p1 TRINITY_DN16779_c0_g1~~TRINITY_DN16779_c0_g1_i1.p1  ORF type:complete len:669 (+),score=115.56 TRINITY_DN16779_c0_g1_i1:108-2114(+)
MAMACDDFPRDPGMDAAAATTIAPSDFLESPPEADASDGGNGSWRNGSSQTMLAPLATPESLERVPMDQIDSGPVDYVIKCTQGLFAGRFIYVNRTPQGELFGSDKGSKDITMYIENANLSPKHAEIKFNEQTYQYFLRDFASSNGTWVRIRWNRSIEVAPGQELRIGDTLVEVREGRRFDAEEEVSRWLSSYQLDALAPRLRQSGIASLEDVRSQGMLLLDMVGDLSGEDTNVLTTALCDLEKMFPVSGYPNHALDLVVRRDGNSTYETLATIGWEGGTVALAPNGTVLDEEDGELDSGDAAPNQMPKDVTVGCVPVVGWETCEWLRVGYSFGRYYVHLSERSSDSNQKCWVRLRSNQRHWLQPHDLFWIGSLEFQVLRFNAGVHSEQGIRATMEDEEILLQDLATSNWRHCSFFGIYDGHGGRECVTFVRQRLHMNFVASLHAKGGLDKSMQVHHDIFESLMQGFRETDRQFLSMNSEQKGSTGGSGCVAVVACVVGGWLWCANAGDCRALLCRDGQAIQLSLDHKPDRQDEAERIESAGGFVSFRRVMGRLAVSRAFGDEEYKKISDVNPLMKESLVIADPEIRLERLSQQDEFLFMACDGLFDVFQSQEAVDFIRARLAAMPWNEQDPQRVVQEIVHEAIHTRRTRDNVTALLATFKRSVGPHR